VKSSRAIAPVVHWLQVHDSGYVALRRAGRAAIVMPSVFAISLEVLDNSTVALFAAFSAVAQLMLVSFGGEMRSRLEAQASLAITGALLITLATLACRQVWLAALSMAVVAFVVILLGVVSSVLASATTALLLAFILPVATPAPLSDLSERLIGWGLSSGVAFLAVWLLWPAPAHSPLRANLASTCRTLAARLSSIAQTVPGIVGETAAAIDPVNSLENTFLATPWRPSGLGASDRAIIRLVDEIIWLSSVIDELMSMQLSHPTGEFSREVQMAAAHSLIEAASLLESSATSTQGIQSAQRELSRAISGLENHLASHLSIIDSPEVDAPRLTRAELATQFISSLDFSFRSREIGFAAGMIATNVESAVAAEHRTFIERVLGHESNGTSLWSSARARIASRLQPHSTWLHNSVRGAIGLAIAVAVAEELSVEHSFWVILGTLSVLRSNALSTGQNAARAIGGTLIGFVVGATLVVLIGTNETVFWLLLPVALFIAAFAPTAISFVIGQAGFTFLLVILFNILTPVGWQVGLVRTEDVAIGCAVSAGVSLLIWPRGAAGELGAAMQAAYADTATYLKRATSHDVTWQLASAELSTPEAADRAFGAAQRLDDAFRNYLAERGAKPAALADVTTLVTGVGILRLSADAVIDLWEHVQDDGESWRVARERLNALAASVMEWYDEFADRFVTSATFGTSSTQEVADHEVAEAVRQKLATADQANLASAVRILWTADHLNVAQRLESLLNDAARASEGLWVKRGSSNITTASIARSSGHRDD
jgi:uncharacterized membrane protein YccC